MSTDTITQEKPEQLAERGEAKPGPQVIWKAEIHYVAGGKEVFDQLLHRPTVNENTVGFLSAASLDVVMISQIKKMRITATEVPAQSIIV